MLPVDTRTINLRLGALSLSLSLSLSLFNVREGQETESVRHRLPTTLFVTHDSWRNWKQEAHSSSHLRGVIQPLGASRLRVGLGLAPLK